MALSYQELSSLFRSLDRDPVLMSMRFEGWLAWPLLKERLWRFYLGNPDLRRRNERLSRTLIRLGLGVAELAINLLAPPRREFAVLYSPRHSLKPDGGPMHPQLGDLLNGSQSPRYFRLVYDWERGKVGFPRRGIVNEQMGGSVLAAAAVLSRRKRSIRDVSDQIATRLAQLLPGISRTEIRRICADQLARFGLKRRVWQYIFARAGVRSILVLDPDAKTSEIAAAKAEGIAVVEMQHGMFSSDEPDYSWVAAHRALKREMAVVDRVLVFGPHWQTLLAKNGFWLISDIDCIGCPSVILFRHARKPNHKPSSPQVEVLFLTQGYVRDTALSFWSSALALQGEGESATFRLKIRLHPAEVDILPYEELVRRFPKNCRLGDSTESVYQAMAEADVVAGFTSLAMIEAVGLGVPTVSICGGMASQGFCGTFGDNGIASVVPHVTQPADFLALIHRYRDSEQYSRWARETAERGAATFSFPTSTLESRLQHALETARSAN